MPITLTARPTATIPVDELRDRLDLAQVPFEEPKAGTFTIECRDDPTADFWEERLSDNWGAKVHREGKADPQQPVEAGTDAEALGGPDEVLPGDAEA